MGEDELDMECVVRVLMYEGFKWKILGKYFGVIVCFFREMDVNFCYMV